MAGRRGLSRPLPPPDHVAPAVRTLEPGRWWRVHAFGAVSGRPDPGHRPDAFNDSGRGNARFSPLTPPSRASSSETLVPTLYAAASIEAALMETVLHNVPYPSQGHIHDLDANLAGPLVVSAIDIRQPLQLADLTQLGLQRMGLRVSQLFETNADDYARTRGWAAWLHAALPAAQGLSWMSARHAEQPALMLFGDRIAPGTVAAVEGASWPLKDPAVYAVLLGLLDRLGCGVAPDR